MLVEIFGSGEWLERVEGRRGAIPDRIGRLSVWQRSAISSGGQVRDHRGRHRRGAAERIDGGAVVLDVREPDEYDQGALPGASTSPAATSRRRSRAGSPTSPRPVVVYCAGGVRSAFAATHAAGARLHRRRVDGRRLRPLEGRGPRLEDAGRRSPPSRRNRYKRHLLLPEVGVEGQAKLLDSKVLLLGAGGLGSPAALYLAAAGVGTIGIVDMDEVDASNLQRQILHNVDRIGDRKVDSAKKTLDAAQPRRRRRHVRHPPVDATNIIDIITGYDVIVDGADNFPSRYLLNDASVKLGIPVVHGSIFRFEGMVSVFDPTEGPTYRDMVPEPPPAELAPSCAEAGVLGVLPGIVGSIQALETIKVLARPRRAADRADPHGRHDRDDVPHVQPAGPTRPTRSPTTTATGSRSASSTGSAPPGSTTSRSRRAGAPEQLTPSSPR